MYKLYIPQKLRNQATKILFNFNDLIIGEWGSLDISVDPYTNAAKGGTRIIGLYDVDVAVRHAESFAAIKDLIA